MILIRIYIASAFILLACKYTTALAHPTSNPGVKKSNCRPSELPEGVRIHGGCSFRRQSTCHASCRFGATTLWRRDVRCSSHGNWTTSNRCSPQARTAHFKVIPCSRLVNALPSEKHCVRIWQPGLAPPKSDVCPELLRIYVQLGKCRRVGHGECAVSCLEDGFSLMCMGEGVWYPDCRVAGTHKILCPELEPSTLLNCSRTPGSQCKVRCPNGEVAAKTAICSPTGKWSRVPKCQFRVKCANQKLSVVRFLDPDCKASNRIFCVVACAISSSANRTEARCSTHGIWVGLPDCPSDCPKMKVDKNAVLTSCPATPNSVCKYKCKKGFAKDGTRKCNGGGRWVGRVRCKELDRCPPVEDQFRVQGSCSRFVGFTCRLNCGSQEQWTEARCDESGVWSGLPVCNAPSCPAPPALRIGMKFVGECSGKTSQQQCRIECKNGFSLKGEDHIKCRTDLTWTELPTCEMECPKPPLSKNYLKSSDSCSRKLPGDTCHLSCSEGGNMIGKNTIECLETSVWSDLPDCFCPKPILTEDLKEIQNCSAIRRSEKCELGCRNITSKLTGSNYITCQNNTKWDQLPTCENTFCPPPNITIGVLKAKENCSKKATRQICPLECVKGGNLTGSDHIKCLADQKWSKLPDCTCPIPELLDNLQFEGVCVNITRNKTCKVKCKTGYRTSNKTLITCMLNLSWSNLPTCTKPCPKPNLFNQNLNSSDNCSDKLPGETCSLKCSEGGTMIGKNTIECLKTSVWSGLPDCLCPKPTLTEDLKEIRDCSAVRQSEKCELGCKNVTSKLTGSNYITCQNNTKWDQLPTCENTFCPPPNITIGVLKAKENCSKKATRQICPLECVKGGNLTGSDHIKCLADQNWSKLPDCTCPIPELLDNLQFEGVCVNITRNKTCKVKCKTGYKTSNKTLITCMFNLSWSNLPTCSKPCPKPNLFNQNLNSSDNCSDKLPGETCSLKCSEGGNMIGKNTIECLKTSVWSGLPDCLCPKPTLTEDLKEIRDCSAVRQSKKCELGCKNITSKLTGSNYITCQNNTKWDQLPTCENTFCPPPNITIGVLKAKENCSKKATNQICPLECVKGGNLTGSDHIKCLADQKWSKLPDCTCPIPELLDNLQFETVCVNITRNKTCKVKCKTGYKTSNKTLITCLFDLSWSNLPTCIKLCPKPDLFGKNMNSFDSCSDKIPGDTCSLSCSGGGNMIGNNTIECLETSEWSDLPNCFCPKPILTNDLKEIGNCSAKRRNEKCQLSCRNSTSKLTGSNSITCQNNMTWDSLPKCSNTCPDLNFVDNILTLTENCSTAYPGIKCHVKCTNDGNIIGNANYIECLNGSIWSAFPQCTCADPLLGGTNLIKIENDCSSKKPNDKCFLKCSTGYKIGNTNYMECLNSTQWSPLPICNVECPVPALTVELSDGGVEFVGSCVGKIENENCLLRCLVNNKELLITCLHTGKWSARTQCVKWCGFLSGAHAIVTFPEKCWEKSKGDKCYFHCTHKGNVIGGKNYVVCQEDGQWSPFPRCYCAPPNLSPEFSVQGDCSNKEYYETCVVTCADPNKKMAGGQKDLFCNERSKWDVPGGMECFEIQRCPPIDQDIKYAHLFQPGAMFTRPVDDCEAKKPGEWCNVSCTHGGPMQREARVDCLENATWGVPPLCMCKPPDVWAADPDNWGLCQGNLIPQQSKCTIKCREGHYLEGNADIECDISAKWAALPICTTCPLPEESPNEIQRNECNIGVDRIRQCTVYCEGTETLQSTCQENRLGWIPPPECRYCPDLEHFPGEVWVKEGNSMRDCNKILPRGWCKFTCRNGALIETVDIFTNKKLFPVTVNLRCTENSTWSIPYTMRCLCVIPTVVGGIVRGKDTRGCDMYSCVVECLEGNKLIGDENIQCQLESLTWTPFPVCARPCPRIDLHLQSWFSNILLLYGTCFEKFSGDACRLICKSGGKITGDKEKFRLELGVVEGMDMLIWIATVFCTENGTWSDMPDCTCPIPPHLGLTAGAKKGCENNLRGHPCNVECAVGFGKNLDTLQCDINAQWTENQEPCVAFPQMQIPGDPYVQIPGDPYVPAQPPQILQPQPPQILQPQQNANPICEGPLCGLKCGAPVIDNVPHMVSRRCNFIGNGETCEITSCDNGFSPQHPITCVVESYMKRYWLGTENVCVRMRRTVSRDVSIRCGGQVPCTQTVFCPPILTDPSLEYWLTDLLIPLEDCSSVRAGMECTVACRNGGNVYGDGTKVMRGNALAGKMACREDGEWEAPFSCKCGAPLHVGLTEETRADCTDVDWNFECLIECAKGYDKRLSAIRCQRNAVWREQIPCVRSLHPKCGLPPVKNADPESLRECARTLAGATCAVTCRPGFVATGDNEILCGEDLEWQWIPVGRSWDQMTWFGDLVRCEPLKYEKTCLYPVHPFLTPAADCNWKFPPARCPVSCIGGGEIVGAAEMKCIHSHQQRWTDWYRIPDCTCPPVPSIAYADQRHLQARCSRVSRGGTCHLRCLPGLQVFGDPELRCTDLARWNSPLPACGRRPLVRCGSLIHDLFIPTKDCNGMFPGEYCRIRCRAGGYVVEGEPYVLCDESGKWSGFPDCTCSIVDFVPHAHVEDLVRCSEVRRGNRCIVRCKKGYHLRSGNTLICNSTAQWEDSRDACIPEWREGDPPSSVIHPYGRRDRDTEDISKFLGKAFGSTHSDIYPPYDSEYFDAYLDA